VSVSCQYRDLAGDADVIGFIDREAVGFVDRRRSTTSTDDGCDYTYEDWVQMNVSHPSANGTLLEVFVVTYGNETAEVNIVVWLDDGPYVYDDSYVPDGMCQPPVRVGSCVGYMMGPIGGEDRSGFEHPENDPIDDDDNDRRP